MRAELLSLVVDMALDPKAIAEQAIVRVEKELGTTIWGDQRQMMLAAGVIAVQSVMTEVRVMAGRAE